MKSKRAREAAVADEPVVAQAEEQPAKKRKRDNEDGEAAGSGKKSKKDKKDKKKDRESRKDKKDKRKDLMNLPGEDVADEEEAVPETETAEAKKEKKEKKKEKKEKKAKKEKSETEDKVETADKAEVKEAKKDKKSKKSKTNGETAQPTTNGTESTATTTAPTTNGTTNGTEGIDLDSTVAAKADRHIVFVGNLPFSATAASISAHFASLSPIAVRCLTNKGDKNPCKGIAFVEFGSVHHQRTCLDKFHHSMFDDGSAAGRRINVELTAGGGGKTKHRQEKIREKNIKLDENRAKRIEKEKNTKEEAAKNGTNGAKAPAAAAPYQPDEDHMHPSRRARVPGLGR